MTEHPDLELNKASALPGSPRQRGRYTGSGCSRPSPRPAGHRREPTGTGQPRSWKSGPLDPAPRAWTRSSDLDRLRLRPPPGVRVRSWCCRHPAAVAAGLECRAGPGSTAGRRSAFMEVRDYIEDNAEGFFEALKRVAGHPLDLRRSGPPRRRPSLRRMARPAPGAKSRTRRVRPPGTRQQRRPRTRGPGTPVVLHKLTRPRPDAALQPPRTPRGRLASPHRQLLAIRASPDWRAREGGDIACPVSAAGWRRGRATGLDDRKFQPAPQELVEGQLPIERMGRQLRQAEPDQRDHRRYAAKHPQPCKTTNTGLPSGSASK